jgi:DNA-binding transcriptional regulator LsrR (DeoR family)
MRKIRKALRLKAAGPTQCEIAASLGVGRTTIGEYLDRAARDGLTWPLLDELDDAVLERRLFSSAGGGQGQARPQPDWQHIHRVMGVAAGAGAVDGPL